MLTKIYNKIEKKANCEVVNENVHLNKKKLAFFFTHSGSLMVQSGVTIIINYLTARFF